MIKDRQRVIDHDVALIGINHYKIHSKHYMLQSLYRYLMKKIFDSFIKRISSMIGKHINDDKRYHELYGEVS